MLVLVNPPVSRFDSSELAPPLGLLYVAQRARALGQEVQIVDLNLPQYRMWGDDSEQFYQKVLEVLDERQPSDLGLTSMGVNSHVALEIARRAKTQWGCEITLGGVHFSSIAQLIYEHFPFVDRVATPEIRRSSAGREKWWGEGLNGAAAEPRNVDSLFTGVDLSTYFAANERHLVDYDWGSGCKYNCSFCYSPKYHGNWSTMEPSLLLEEMSQLESLGVNHVFLVEDNLLNSVSWLEEVAASLVRGQSSISWNGYATFPDLAHLDFDLVSAAGCMDLYVGVDSVNSVQQRSWHKYFVREWAKLFERVEKARDAKMSLTCSYILDLEGSYGALTDSLGSALGVRASGGAIRLSVLTPYPGTDLEAGCMVEDWSYDEFRLAALMDLPLVVVQNPVAQVAKRAFPWHFRPQGLLWEQSILAVLVAQEWINNNDLRTDFAVSPEGGAEFWQRCLAVAAALEGLEVNKVELKTWVRRLIQEQT